MYKTPRTCLCGWCPKCKHTQKQKEYRERIKAGWVKPAKDERRMPWPRSRPEERSPTGCALDQS